jgi:head-tail adaptor
MVRPTKMDVVVPMTVVNPNDNQTYRVTALGDGAFTVYGLRGGWFDYTSIVLPEGLLEIKANAFSGQSKLTSLVIPGTVKSVKTKFAQMSGISELTFPASVKEMVTIESGRIQKLTIEGSQTITAGSRDYITGSVTNNIVYFIDNDTSYKNVEITLTSAVPPTLPEVTRIQYKAYSGRTTVHVPEGCSDAYNAAGWNQAEVLVEGTDHADVDGIRYYHDSHRAIGYDVVSELNGPLNIPQTVQIGGKTYPVEVLAVRMFEGEGESLIKNITAITLNEGLTEIGEMGFFNCSKIKELELPASLTTMGSNAFWNIGIKVVCHSAAPLTLPKSTTYSYQFKKCTVIVPVGSVAAYVAATDKGWDESNTYLTFAGLADGVEYRANDTEAWVTAVADDTVVADIKDYLSIDGSQMPVTRIDAAFSGKTQLQKVTVPVAVKALPENMFRDCTSLNAVTFASGSQLQTIGKWAFMSTAVAAIEIPEGVTELPDGVFKNCLSLTEITLPSNLVSVGGGCFYNCKALTTVNVCADNLTIADRAFYSCESLETINSANPLQLSSDISKLGMEFEGCKSLKAVSVAGGMIGSFAFDGCESLVSVGIAEGVKTIGKYAFDGCTSLKRILLPASLQEIKHETFRNVVFEEITCLAVTPPSIRDNTFTDYSAHLCVPAESMAAYAAATGWKEFSNIGDLTTSGVSAVAGDGLSVAVCDGRICVDGVGETEMIKVYSAGGMLVGMGLNRQVEVPSPGVYIVEFKKGTVKVAIR